MSPISQKILDRLNIDVSTLSGVTQDSREVREGYLFAALQGRVDGRSFIPDALNKGASVILSDHSVRLPEGHETLLICDDHPRAAFAHIVAAYYDAQPDHVVAVTGTNGKSSVVHFIHQMWQEQ